MRITYDHACAITGRSWSTAHRLSRVRVLLATVSLVPTRYCLRVSHYARAEVWHSCSGRPGRYLQRTACSHSLTGGYL